MLYMPRVLALITVALALGCAEPSEDESSALASYRAGAPSPIAPAAVEAEVAQQNLISGTTDCGSGVYLGVYASVRSRTVGSRTIRLMNERFSDHSHAQLDGYENGDRVWIDRSNTCGDTWFQCGPFGRADSNEMSNRSHSMRACFDTRGAVHCTDWYFEGADGERYDCRA